MLPYRNKYRKTDDSDEQKFRYKISSVSVQRILKLWDDQNQSNGSRVVRRYSEKSTLFHYIENPTTCSKCELVIKYVFDLLETFFAPKNIWRIKLKMSAETRFKYSYKLPVITISF
jgi:hypothetical protein